ncbi:MAG: FkbM family methyltransferase [Isosphaeraceae bacterium]
MGMESARLALACVLRPVLGRLPRGSDRAYRYVLGQYGSSYLSDPHFKRNLKRRYRIFLDRHVGCYVVADVGDCYSRNHYITGRYYERFVPLLIRRLLDPGDTFIDVGANRGIHSMFAARFLERGRVVSFEPNPETFRVLQAHITINGLTNCEPHNIGLSDEAGVLELRLLADDHPTSCTFLDTGADVKQTFSVPIKRLDEVLGGDAPRGKMLVKVDAEGFDHKVIRGLGRLLDFDQLAIATEVVDDWLRKTGSSAQALFSEMIDHGFLAFLPSVKKQLLTERLHLEPLRRGLPAAGYHDILFAKPGIAPEN